MIPTYQNPYLQQYQIRPNSGIIWVQGIEGAKAYQLTPNSVVVLMDSEIENRFYIKVSDNVGMCSLRLFNYTEVTEQPKLALDTSKYVTREEFEQLKELINNGKQSVSAAAEQSAAGKRSCTDDKYDENVF